MAAAASQPAQRAGVAVLPGSRLQEVEQNLSLLAEAVKGLETPLTFAVAPSLEIEDVKDAWAKLGGTEASYTRDVYTCLKGARAALVCSGTATLEAAICSCPSVVFYKISKWLEVEAKIVKPKFDWVSLPNILLDRGVIPELLQHDATPSALRAELNKLLEDGEPRDTQLMAFSELRQSLGLPDCLGKTALLAAELLESSR
jgi:lipid-A-disaccharide synthase